jgi:hypothetical protein
MIALLAVPACKFNCTMGGGIDSKKVEQAILDANKDAMTKVTCPSDVSSTVGSKFECQADLKSGAQTTFTVTINDDSGNVSFEPKK